jgi:ABC-type long-subunit fatty acid transport system fused permease/ATPase subunit
MKKTTAFEKLTTSIINVLFVLIIFLPFYFIISETLAKKYSKPKQITYSILYTLSFSTILFSIFFPFDLLLFNILLLQLPTIIFKKTTLQGYLSGNITTVKNN